MYHIAICDDNAADREQLKQALLKNGNCPENIRIYEFASGAELTDSMETLKFALVFLDIRMEGMDGNETALQVRQRDSRLILVFITAYCDPVPVNFEAQPYRYLKKQITESEWEENISQIFKKMIADAAIPTLTAIIRDVTVVIYPEDIVYIEKYKRKCRLYLSDPMREQYELTEEDIVVSDEKLVEIYSRLKFYGFGCPHDSYIINFKYVVSITKNYFELKDITYKFSISRSKFQEFNQQKNRFFVSKYVDEV